MGMQRVEAEFRSNNPLRQTRCDLRQRIRVGILWQLCPTFSNLLKMRNGPGHDGKTNDKVKNRTVFKDGSELVEFEGGSMMIVESGLAKALIGAEQPARYDQPAPRPPEDRA